MERGGFGPLKLGGSVVRAKNGGAARDWVGVELLSDPFFLLQHELHKLDMKRKHLKLRMIQSKV